MGASIVGKKRDSPGSIPRAKCFAPLGQALAIPHPAARENAPFRVKSPICRDESGVPAPMKLSATLNELWYQMKQPPFAERLLEPGLFWIVLLGGLLMVTSSPCGTAALKQIALRHRGRRRLPDLAVSFRAEKIHGSARRTRRRPRP